MLNNLSLKWKGMLIILFCLSGMFVQQYFSITNARAAMMQEKEVKLKELVDTMFDSVKALADLAKKGDISEDEAKELARNLVRGIRYNEFDDYFFIFDYNGTCEAHGFNRALEGRPLIDLKDPNGVYLIRELVAAAKNNGGFVSYHWERDKVNVPKLSYATGYQPWNWMISTGIYIDDVDKAFYANIKRSLILVSIILLVVAGFTYFVIQNIITPILATSEQMTAIADKKDVAITGTERKDELGLMARTLGTLKEAVEAQRRLEKELAEAEVQKQAEQKKMLNKMADNLDSEVGSVVSVLEKAVNDMQLMSDTLAAASEETTRQSSSVAAASEQASSNVQTVAAASEELSASIKELVNNVSNTARATKACTEEAKVSQDYLELLQKAVDEIDGVIKDINDVAEQTNLLALNATIEAARAGDAGKGFAVVASEVKSLAGETNKMTEEIASKINTIKTSAADTIKSVNDIVKQISSIDNMTASISSAIEEQNASTSEISRSATEAASFTGEVSHSIVEVQSAAKDTATSTNALKDASNNLSKQSQVLRSTVSEFIKKIRES